MNDFHHLLFAHHRPTDYEYIQDSLEVCDISKCQRFNRHYLRRRGNSNDSDIKYDGQDMEDIVHQMNVIEILDTIHCHFCHKFDIRPRTRLKMGMDHSDIEATLDSINPSIINQAQMSDIMMNKDNKSKLDNRYLDGIQCAESVQKQTTKKKNKSQKANKKAVTKGNEPLMFSYGVRFEYDIYHDYVARMSHRCCIRYVPMRYLTFITNAEYIETGLLNIRF